MKIQYHFGMGTYTLTELNDLLVSLNMGKDVPQKEFDCAENNLRLHFDGYVRKELQNLEMKITSMLRKSFSAASVVQSKDVHFLTEVTQQALKKIGVSEITISIKIPASSLKKRIFPIREDDAAILKKIAVEYTAAKARKQVESIADEVVDGGGEEMTVEEMLFLKIDEFINLCRDNGISVADVADISDLKGGFQFAFTTLLSSLETAHLNVKKIQNDSENLRFFAAEYAEGENLPDENFAVKLEFRDDFLSMEIFVNTINAHKTTLEKLRPAIIDFLRQVTK